MQLYNLTIINQGLYILVLRKKVFTLKYFAENWKYQYLYILFIHFLFFVHFLWLSNILYSQIFSRLYIAICSKLFETQLTDPSDHVRVCFQRSKTSRYVKE